MIEQKDINTIKETIKEFFAKMTMPILDTKADLSGDSAKENKEVVNLEIKVEEPQILIGQGGQTLFEIQRLLKTILNKKLQKIFFLNLDINDYKKKKIEYLKDLAKDLADQVSLSKEEKALSPMLAYERRVIHAELSLRSDITTESRGEGVDRYIVIKPKQ